jgi:hypothetical protein
MTDKIAVVDGINMPAGLPRVPTNDLLPYARNARTHSADQIALLGKSIEEFGFTNPILIDADGIIVAGHGRALAAKLIGLSEVPVIRLGYLTEAQRQAYVIADNQIALNAGWDYGLLAEEIATLNAVDFDLDVLGFNDAQIGSLLDGLDAVLADAPRAPSAPSVLSAPYAPNYSPETGGVRPPTQDDVNAARDRLAAQFHREAPKREICCPECAHVFHIDQ